MYLKNGLPILIVILLMLLLVPYANAGTAGTVTHVSGPLAARKGDGKIKALAINSSVESGDTLITEKRTYARIKFLDNSEITLKPNTQFIVEEFGFSKDKPGEDKAVYNLVKGGLRSVTGQIGKRNGPDSYKLKTPTATIGVRGTIYTADYIEAEQPQTAVYPLPVRVAMAEAPVVSDAVPVLIAQAPSLAAGLYVHVIDGIINLTNRGGSQSFTAGQFGFTPSLIKPPVIVPNNPGIQFTPPPAFSSSSVGNGARNSANSNPKTVDCEVR